MTVAALVFEVNWNGDGTTWVDESANVLKVYSKRGRDYASMLTGRAQAGELTVQLQNVAQRYSDFNSSGPLYGNIIPGRKVRWRATAPVARTLWQGFLSDPNPDPGDRRKVATATLRCSGVLWWVAEQESNTALQTSIASGTAAGLVLDDAGWPAGDRAIDTGQLVMVRWKADTIAQADGARADPRKALIHLQELEESEMGFLSESADGKIVFEDAHHRLLSPHTVSQATFSDAAAASLFYDAISELSPWRIIFNRFSAEVTAVSNGAGGSTLWNLTGETPAIGPGSTWTVTAIYPSPDSAVAAVDVSAWGTPTVLANAAADGSGIDLSSSIGIATVKHANTMDITLTNNGTRVAYIIQLQATGTPGVRGDTGRVQESDSASIAKYGKRTYPLGGRFYPTLARAREFCQWGLSRYKDPQPILEVTYQADASAAHMTQALTRDISERITLVASGTTPAGAQLGINGDFFIETIIYEYTLPSLLVTYRLSYAGDSSLGGDTYWNLGLATLGATTKLVI